MANNEKTPYTLQLYGAVAVGLCFSIVRYDMTYLTFAIPGMRADQNFPLNNTHAQWMPATYFLMTILGNLVAPRVVDTLGRRTTVLGGLAMHTVGTACYLVSPNSGWVLAVRGLAALGSSLLMMAAMLYSSEVGTAENKDRDNFVIRFCADSGVLLSFAVGYWFSWRHSPSAIIGLAAACAGLLMQLPESPRFLVLNNRIDEAKQAVIYLEKSQEAAEKFVQDVLAAQERAKALNQSNKVTLREVFLPPYQRPVLTVLYLSLGAMFTGAGIISNRAVPFFQAFKTSIDPRTCTLMIGILSFFIGILASIVNAKCPRIPTLFVSTLVVLNCLVGLSIYHGALHSQGPWSAWAEDNSVVLVVLVAFYFTAFNISPKVAPFTYMGEGIPNRIKSVTNAIVFNFNLLAATFMSLSFGSLVNTFSYTYVLLGLAALSGLFTFLGTSMMIETKHLTLGDIDDHYEKLLQDSSKEKKDL